MLPSLVFMYNFYYQVTKRLLLYINIYFKQQQKKIMNLNLFTLYFQSNVILLLDTISRTIRRLILSSDVPTKQPSWWNKDTVRNLLLLSCLYFSNSEDACLSIPFSTLFTVMCKWLWYTRTIRQDTMDIQTQIKKKRPRITFHFCYRHMNAIQTCINNNTTLWTIWVWSLLKS